MLAMMQRWEENQPAPRIYNRALITLKNQGLHSASKISIPEFQQIKSSIYRNRNKLAHVKKICAKTVEEVEVPNTFSEFLLADFRHKKNENFSVLFK